MAETTASVSKTEDGPAPKKMRKVPTVAENRAQLARMTLGHIPEDRLDECVHVIVKDTLDGAEKDWASDPCFSRLSSEKLSMDFALKSAVGTLVYKIETGRPEKVVKHLDDIEYGIDKDWAIYINLSHDDEILYGKQISKLASLYQKVLELYPFAYEVKTKSSDSDNDSDAYEDVEFDTIGWDATEYANSPNDAMDRITERMSESVAEFISMHKKHALRCGEKCREKSVLAKRIVELQDRITNHDAPVYAPLVRIYVH